MFTSSMHMRTSSLPPTGLRDGARVTWRKEQMSGTAKEGKSTRKPEIATTNSDVCVWALQLLVLARCRSIRTRDL